MNLADDVQAIVAVAGLVGTMMAGAGGMLWKVSQWAATARASDAKHDAATIALAAQLEAMKRSLAQMSHLIVELKGNAGRSEKDLAKLEGKIEQNSDALVRVVAGLQEATGSLDALWRTLKSIFPDKVPRRASDRGGPT